MKNLGALKLAKAPIIMTLGAVEFSQVVNIAEYVPKLQDRLRKEGFPFCAYRTVRQMRLTSTAVTPKVEEHKIFGFYNETKSRVITVNPETISLAVTDYQTFEDFSNNLRLGLSAMSEIVKPNFTLGLGFRHVNLIGSSKHRSLLRPEFHGMAEAALGQPRHSRQEYSFWADIEKSSMRIRLTLGRPETSIPEEIREMGLPVKPLKEMTETVYTLDIDHRTDFDVPFPAFDADTVLGEMRSLHDGVNLAFVSTVTDEALTYWGNETT